MPSSPTSAPRPPDRQTEEALQLLYRHLPEPRRTEMASLAREALRRQEVSLFAAEASGHVVGAILYHAAAGALGLVFPPQTIAGSHREAIENFLVQGVLRRLQRLGSKQCQLVLEPGDVELARPLLRNGFVRVAQLWCMQRRLADPVPAISDLAELRFEACSECDPSAFRDTLAQTYEGTLDCPELNGIRTAEEEIASHRAHGIFDPTRWWLVRLGGVPAGVLLVNQWENRAVWELLYMGLVRAFRGRALGRHLMHRALTEARAGGGEWMVLTLDSRNAPAFALYRQMGFERSGEREVFLKALPPEA